jgi:molecular chaperone IbpA
MVSTYSNTKGSSTWNTLFSDPFLIGFTREVDRLNTLHKNNSSVSYPPYNVIKFDEDTYSLDLAVAGFDKDDLDISVKDNNLIIKGDKKPVEEDGEYVYRGIATRKFTRSFALGEYMEVAEANVKNGILSVYILRVVPEEKKPKQISIN